MSDSQPVKSYSGFGVMKIEPNAFPKSAIIELPNKFPKKPSKTVGLPLRIATHSHSHVKPKVTIDRQRHLFGVLLHESDGRRRLHRISVVLPNANKIVGDWVGSTKLAELRHNGKRFVAFMTELQGQILDYDKAVNFFKSIGQNL